MKYILPALFILLTVTFKSFAQAPAVPKLEIKGTVIDSATNKPVPFVTVILKAAGTTVPLKSVLTKDNGGFVLSGVVGKAYQVGVASLGYRTKTVNVPSAAAGTSTVDLKSILIAPSSGQLKEVAITDSKPLIKQEVDRIAYDVQADPESKEQNGLDMMRKVPLISVDANDNIQLKGSGSYKILINGKESAMMAKNPSDILKAMPASNIEKIEVITTPPAKYDAEGLAGIINIITKKNADQGYNGSLNGRMNNVYGPGINLNGTVKQGKFGVSGYLGYGYNGHQTGDFGTTQSFFSPRSVISQNGSSTYTGNNKYGEIDLSYEIDTLNLLTVSTDFYNGLNDQNRTGFSVQTDAIDAVTQQYELDNYNHETYLGFDGSVNYQLGFHKSKDQLLTLSYKFDFSPDKEFSQNNFSNAVNYPLPDYQQYNNSGNRTQTFQLDYVQPVKKILNIEAGGKAILRNNYSNFVSNNYDGTTNEYDIVTQTNDFNYHQDVYSVYNSYQLKMDKWAAKAGLRLEHTQINADFTSVGANLDDAYSNLIPSVSLQRSFKSSSITFGFTQRIQRPGIWQLNPFVDKSNPEFWNTGNPDLRPELSNTFELNYSNFAKGSINVGLSYAFSNNSIQRVTNTAAETLPTNAIDTVTITSYQNLGSNKKLGLNVNTSYNFTKALSLSINAQLSYVWLKGTYNSQFYTNSGVYGNAFGNAAYKFDSGFRIGFNAGYYSGNVNLQGKNGYGLYSSYLISQEFLKKKLILALVANNPYSKFFKYTSYTSTPDFYESSFNNNTYRTFAIRFNYKFGKLTSDIKKNKQGINNDDTKSGGGGSSGGN